MLKRALIAGSFDPVTVGHLDLIKRAAAIFDEVYVVEFVNSQKEYMFSEELRLKLLTVACKKLENVKVDISDSLVVEYALKKKIDVVVRGLRSVLDFEYESELSRINRVLNPSLETVFLPVLPELSHVSSTFVRELIRYSRDISEYVPTGVAEEISRSFDF